MKKTIAIAFALLLVACKQAPVGWTPEPFTFETNPGAPIRIDVAEIRIVEDFKSPMRRPNVEYEFPVPPAEAVKKWVGYRLEAAGSSGILEVVIADASVREVALPKTKGVKGFFTDDQDTRFDAKLAVTYRLFTGARAISDASADVRITRSHTLNEKATVVDREQLQHRITRDIMENFDRESERRFHHYFSNYLK